MKADYFVDKATNKTVKKSLKPGYARSRFEKSKEKRDLMSEYDHIHEDRSERPTASVWYNDDTRVKTFEIEDATSILPDPDRKATRV
jgi:hypothetical protein